MHLWQFVEEKNQYQTLMLTLSVRTEYDVRAKISIVSGNTVLK